MNQDHRPYTIDESRRFGYESALIDTERMCGGLMMLVPVL